MQTRYFTRGRVPPPRTMVVKRTTIKVVVTSTFLTYILLGRFLIHFYMRVNPPPGRFLIHFYMAVNPPPHQIQGEGRVHRQLRPWKRNHILSSLTKTCQSCSCSCSTKTCGVLGNPSPMTPKFPNTSLVFVQQGYSLCLVSICTKAPESGKPHYDHHSLGDLVASGNKKYKYRYSIFLCVSKIKTCNFERCMFAIL